MKKILLVLCLSYAGLVQSEGLGDTPKVTQNVTKPSKIEKEIEKEIAKLEKCKIQHESCAPSPH